MSEVLFTIKPEDLLVGFAPDLPGQAPPMLDSGKNVAFTDLSVQPIAGQFVIFTGDSVDGEPITGIRATLINGSRLAFIGTPSKLYIWDGEDLTDVSRVGGYTGTAHDLWIMARWGNWIVASNGVNSVQVYKGVSFANLSGVTFTTAQIIITAPGQPFLMAFETAGGSEGGFGMMHWCERDDIETWLGALSNFAGFLPIRDIVSPVIAATSIGGVIPFFTADDMYIASFIGHPLSFGATKVATGIGATGKHSVCTAGGKIYGISSRGIWMSDIGGNYRYFDVPIIREHFLESMHGEEQPHHPVAWHNRAEHAIVFFYPATEDAHGNTAGVMFNYLENNWTILGFGRSVVDDQGVFDFALAGDIKGNLYYQAAPGQAATAAPLPGTGVPGILPFSEDQLHQAGWGIGAWGIFAWGDPVIG